MSWLLDTNVISEWTKPSPAPAVVRWLDAQLESTLFLSVVTFAELRRGVALLPEGPRRDALRAWVDGALSARFSGRVLSIDRAVADTWGDLLAHAKRHGQALHAMDGFVAATAAVHDLTLVTRNTKDFHGLGLSVFDPWTSG